MEIIDQPKALDDLKYWKKSRQKQMQTRILSLIQSIQNSPFEGKGKPEPIKHNWTSMWSRRINNLHRIIYEIKDNDIHVYSLKDHY